MVAALEASGSSSTDLTTTDNVETFSSTAEFNSIYASNGTYSTTNTWSSSNGESSSSGSGSSSASFSSDVSVFGSGSASGTDDETYSSGSSIANFSGQYKSNSQVGGSSSGPDGSTSFSSASSSDVNDSGSIYSYSTSTPEETVSSGSTSLQSTSLSLTASQVYGTEVTPDGVVPFRTNSASRTFSESKGGVSGRAVSTNSGSGSSLLGADDDTTYFSNANFSIEVSDNTRSSSYVGIVGEFSGSALTKSVDNSNVRLSLSATDNNGSVSGEGFIASKSNGSSDTKVTVSGASQPDLSTHVSANASISTGTKYSSGFSGGITFNADDSTTSRGQSTNHQENFGNSSLNFSSSYVHDSDFAFSSASITGKFKTSSSSSGGVVSSNGEVQSESASISGGFFQVGTSNSSLAGSVSSENGNSTFSANNYGKAVVSGSASSSEGSGGQSSGSVSFNLIAQSSGNQSSATVSRTDNQTSATSSSSQTKSSLNTSLGGQYINGISTLNASQSSQASSEGQSQTSGTTISPNGSSSFASSQMGSLNQSQSASIGSMEAAGIVGFETGSVSVSGNISSTGTSTVQSNFQADNVQSWQSGTTSFASSSSYSASSIFFTLSGGDDSSGTNDSLSWSVGSSTSNEASFSGGSFAPLAGGDDLRSGAVSTQFSQEVRVSIGASASDTNPEGFAGSSLVSNGNSISNTVLSIAGSSDGTNGSGESRFESVTLSGQVSFNAGFSVQGNQVSRDAQYSTTSSLNSFIRVAVAGEKPDETNSLTLWGSSLQYESTGNSETGTVSRFRILQIERTGSDDLIAGWDSAKTVRTTGIKSVTTAYATNGTGRITTKLSSVSRFDTHRWLDRTFDQDDVPPNWYVVSQKGNDHTWSGSSQSSVTSRSLGQEAAQVVETDFTNFGGREYEVVSKNAGISVDDKTVSKTHKTTIDSWYKHEFEGLGDVQGGAVDSGKFTYHRKECFIGTTGFEDHLGEGESSQPCTTTGNPPESKENDETKEDARQESGRAAFSSLRDGDSSGDSYDPNQNQYRQDDGDNTEAEALPKSISSSLYAELLKDGKISRYEGLGTDYFIVSVNGRKYVYQEYAFGWAPGGEFIMLVVDGTVSDDDAFNLAFGNTLSSSATYGGAVGGGLKTSGKALTNTAVKTVTIGIVDEAIPVTVHDSGYAGAAFGFEAAVAAIPGTLLTKVDKVSKTATIIRGVQVLDTAQAVVTTGRGAHGIYTEGWNWRSGLQFVGGLVGLPLVKWAGQIGDAVSTALKRTPNSAGTSLVPRATKTLGEWGETRLGHYLGWSGTKPTKPFVTKYGKRYPDRLVNGISHEAKAGLNVSLTTDIATQIAKDKELIELGLLKGAHWHFFRGAKKELLDHLTDMGIPYTVH